MIAAVVLSAVSIIFYIGSSITFSLISLSRMFAAAVTAPEQQQLIAAGKILLSKYGQLYGFKKMCYHFALLSLLLSGLFTSLSMRTDKTFAKGIVVMGFIAHVSGLLYFIVLPIFPELIFLPITISAPFIIVWYLLISIKMFRVGKAVKLLNKNILKG